MLSSEKPLQISNRHRYALSISSAEIPAGITFQPNSKTDLFFVCGNEEFNLKTKLLDDIEIDENVNVIDFDINVDKSNITVPNSTDIVHDKYESIVHFFYSVKNLRSHSTIFYGFIFFLVIAFIILLYVFWVNKMKIFCSVLRCCYQHA